MDSYENQYRFYRSQHRTLGCKLTHMFGVPIIIISAPVAFFHIPLAAGLCGLGWALQFIGHYVFEKNSPVFFEGAERPLTFIVAVVFVGDEWLRLLNGKSLIEPDDQAPSKASSKVV